MRVDGEICRALAGQRLHTYDRGSVKKGVFVIATLYGIKHCDTMKKARAWLDGRGVGYRFHDYKTAGSTGRG
jgi:hypothetical protein